MSDYKTIHGVNVRDYTTDPDTLITGQVWYDTTNKVLQFQATGAGSWASGGNMNTAREDLAASKQDSVSTLAFGGASPARALTEDWNGASWSEVADLNTARDLLAGAGATGNTAALAFGGETSPGVVGLTEDWSGSSTVLKTVDTD